MTSASTTCGNCGTENPEGQDFCTKCGEPLTLSADESMREHEAAQERGAPIGGDTAGIEMGGMATPLDVGLGVTREGTPPSPPPRE